MTHGLAAWRDELVAAATRTGVLEGKREGEHEAALRFADFLKAKGFSVNEIAEATGLIVDEIL